MELPGTADKASTRAFAHSPGEKKPWIVGGATAKGESMCGISSKSVWAYAVVQSVSLSRNWYVAPSYIHMSTRYGPSMPEALMRYPLKAKLIVAGPPPRYVTFTAIRLEDEPFGPPPRESTA